MNRLPHRFTAAAICLTLAAGCSTAAPPKEDVQQNTVLLDGTCAGRETYAAEVLAEAAESLARHYKDRHRYCDEPGGCPTPWYTGGEAGEMVPIPLRMFAGGRSYEWSSRRDVPRAGETYELQPATDPTEAAVVEQIGKFDSDYPVLCFRYEYETNGEVGNRARATLRAVIDFDPDSPKNHTLVREVSVDDVTYQVEVSPLTVMSPGQ